jgi:hypothetical protein
MLSLSPRYDLFRFALPDDFLPTEVKEKYAVFFKNQQAVITSPIDYLNESIQGVDFPGVSDVIVQQGQRGTNSIDRKLGKINVEPKTDVVYKTPANPLDKIEHSFKITFRMNQGLYNYFMLYETLFYQICKPLNKPINDVFCIEILNEVGQVASKVYFKNVLMDGIEGLQFNFNKIERDAGTFDVTFKFTNIDFEFVDVTEEVIEECYCEEHWYENDENKKENTEGAI